MKLPRKLRSGRKLVATAAGGRVGLYRLRMLGDDAYRILLPNGKVRKGMLGSHEYPIPPSGHWTWLRSRKKRAREREVKRKRFLMRPEAPRPIQDERVSATQVCMDCRRSVRELKHYHTITGDKGYGAASICCRCARKKRGAGCDIHRDAVRVRKLAAKKSAR